MIKLKDLIMERNEPILTKLEEQNAFNLLINKLVPYAVVSYNNWVSEKKNRSMKKKFYLTTDKEMAKNIKKINREPTEVNYDCELKHGHVEFRIKKNNNPLTNIDEIEIGYLNPADLGWHSSGYRWYSFNDLIRM